MKNFGFVAPKEITPDQYIFGGGNVPKVVLRPNGDWSDIQDKEIQNKQFETYNCTSFNTLAQIEKLIFVLTGEKVNYSDRFLGVVAGTKPPGNDPHTVAEAIRKYGCIPEEMMPFSDDLKNVDEYYSWKGVDKDKCLAEGQKWLQKYTFLHEWVFKPGSSVPNKITSLVDTLTMCPPSVAVYAWIKENGVYVDKGQEPNHWTGMVKDNPLKNWLINDSYIEDFSTLKELDWNYNFQFCKRYYIALKEYPTPQQLSWFSKILDIIKSILNIQKQEVEIKKKDPEPIMETNEEKKESNADKLLRIADAFASKVPKVDITPNDEIPDDRACVSNLCELINEVVDFPRLSYTPTLVKEFKQDPRFKAKLDIEAGDILVNATVGENIGHTGIVGKNGRVMSGNSKTGNWEYNYTIDSWKKFFKIQKGLPTQVFRLQG